MRVTILAGLIMGVALAVQSVLSAHARAKVVHAASAVRVHQSAPWYIATNDGHSADARGSRAGRPGARLI
jgi:hypothetical protein